MKDLLKKGTSLMLVLAMLMGMCATAFATGERSGDNSIDYVSLGASNVNGYGMRGYFPVEGTGYSSIDELMEAAALNASIKDNANVLGYRTETPDSYPVLVRDALDELGMDVDLHQLAISSMRVEELRILLDNDYMGDSYSSWRFVGPGKWFDIATTGGLEGLRVDYQDTIRNADLVSVDIGMNNFGVYLSTQLADNHRLDNDLSLIDPELGEQFEAGKAYVQELIEEYVPEYSELLIEMDELINTLAYSLVGFCYNFDKVMEKIYELNPDATVVVVSIQNLMEGLHMTLPGMDVVLPLGDLFGGLINAANIYIAGGSPYADRYLCADVRKDGRVEYFIDDLRTYNGDPATLSKNVIDCFDVLDGTPGTSYSKKLHVKYMVHKELGDEAIAQLVGAGAYDTVMNVAYDVIASILQYGALGETMDMNVASAIDAVGDAFMAGLQLELKNAVMGAIGAFLNGSAAEYNFDYTVPETFFEDVAKASGYPVSAIESALTMYVRTDIGNSFFGHPNPNGHKEVADSIMAALENGTNGGDILYDEALIALKQIYDLVLEYYDEAYEFGYDYAKNNGYIDAAIEALTYAENELVEIRTWVEANSGEMTADFVAQLLKEIDTAIATIAQVKSLIGEADALDEAALTEALELLALLEQNLDNIVALLLIAEEHISAAAYAQMKIVIDELIERVETLNAYVENELIPAVDKAIREAYEYAVNYLRDLVAKFEVAVVELKAALLAHVDEKVAAAIVGIEAAIAELKAAVEHQINMTIEQFQIAVETAVKEMTVAIVELIHSAQQQGENWVKVVVDQFVSRIMAIYRDATHGEYAKGEDSYYVAIGDDSITGNSYVDMLAEQLGVEYKNIGTAGLNIADSAAVLVENAKEIAGADLITVGFSNNTMIDYMVDQMKAALLGHAIDEYDWSKYLNEDGIAYVEQALAEVRSELIAQGLKPQIVLGKEIDTVELMLVAIEAYAYSYSGYLFGYPKLIEAIRAINQDALIVSVGQNNPLKDLTLKQGETVLAVGEYVQYLIDATNAEALAFAVLTGETVFVDAPDVETIAEENNSVVSTSITKFILNVIVAENGTAVFYASADGHAYIAEQILKALTVTEKQPDIPAVVMGDVTGDGVVDVGDAVMMLKAIAAKTTGEFSVEMFTAADVTRDGVVDVGDAVKLLKAIASKTTDEL